LDAKLAKFYESLLVSEARHFQDYLQLAALYSSEPIAERIEFFRVIENELIQSVDEQFRFHSGA
jgi:tRNA-(ms[2]io[6]A)-hydroxylase